MIYKKNAGNFMYKNYCVFKRIGENILKTFHTVAKAIILMTESYLPMFVIFGY